MRIVAFLYRLPVLPIMIGYELYVINRIVKESNIDDLMEIQSNGELKNHTEPHMDTFRKDYAGALHLFSILSWITFIRIVILHH
jgi:hypothetical protein